MKHAVRGAFALTGLLVAACLPIPASAQVPIIQPGAPGEPVRVIDAQEAAALAEIAHSQADVRFMQHMIVHHAQAIEMNALIAGRTDHPVILLTGERIALSQRDEIALMENWLKRRGEPVEADGLHTRHGDAAHQAGDSDVPLMAGMLSPAKMAELATASGTRFDRLFLSGMIQHHQGAIDMVERLAAQPRSGQEPLLSEFIGGIVADQSAEISRMQAMLAALEAGQPSGEEEK